MTMHRARAFRSMGVVLFGVAGLAVVVVGAACGPKPPLPSEAEARAAYAARRATLTELEVTLLADIRAAGLNTPRATCSGIAEDPDGDACLQRMRERDEKIADARKHALAVLTPLDVACAELVVSTSGVGEELSARVGACAPGMRGDHVKPEHVAGEHRLGWGVYSRDNTTWRRGIAVERNLSEGAATVAIAVYFFID